MRWLSANPEKRRHEIFILVYSPIWIGVIAAAQLLRFFTTWGDWGHLLFGAGLALPVCAAPLFVARDRPFARRHATRYALLIALMSILQCYFGSSLFFDAFGMQYHFHTRWILNGTPLFLYLITIAYFATYYVLMSIAWRALRTRFPSAPPIAVWGARAILSYTIAFMETFTMATDALKDYFSYQHPRAVMGIGSIAYGTLFFLSLPLFYELDEKPIQNQNETAPPLRRLVWDSLAINMLILICYEFYRVAYTRLMSC